jgi:cytochrome c oxidase subunit 2
MPMRRILLLIIGLAALVTTGCHGARSILAPVTGEAERIARTWWLFLVVCVVVYLVVLAVVVAAVARHWSAARPTTGPREHGPETERGTQRLIAVATVSTAAILLGLLGGDLWLQRGLAPRSGDVVAIKLIGHQWWWSAEYQNPDPSQVFETANEIHVPTGRPVRLLLSAEDVIHSFWVPRLHGKRDLVPGHPGEITFQVDQAGRYPGMCAEFCGYQHAHMGISIVAEEPEKFEAWAKAQRNEAAPPTTDTQRRGRELLERTTCAMCHTVHGTEARSRVGPALTHFASRETLGAGVAPNNRERLAAWITDPQAMKPGVRMPASPLSVADREALLDYLEILK